MIAERERLIELLTEAHESWLKCVDDCGFNQEPLSFTFEQMFADHLLSNGVIVAPCKVGDKVYYLTTVDTETELNVAEIFCGTVQAISFGGKNIWLSAKYTNGLFYCHTSKDFGKTVFLTKEEAEAKLKERSEGK